MGTARCFLEVDIATPMDGETNPNVPGCLAKAEIKVRSLGGWHLSFEPSDLQSSSSYVSTCFNMFQLYAGICAYEYL